MCVSAGNRKIAKERERGGGERTGNGGGGGGGGGAGQRKAGRGDEREGVETRITLTREQAAD